VASGALGLDAALAQAVHDGLAQNAAGGVSCTKKKNIVSFFDAHGSPINKDL
jgi:hypothetical protein